VSYKCRICVCVHSSNECGGFCTLNTFAYYCGTSTCIYNIFTCLLIRTWMFTRTLSPFPTSWSSFCCIFVLPFPKLLLNMAFQWENCVLLIVKVIDDNCNDILVKFPLHMLKLWGFLLLWIIHFSSQSLVFCQHPSLWFLHKIFKLSIHGFTSSITFDFLDIIAYISLGINK